MAPSDLQATIASGEPHLPVLFLEKTYSSKDTGKSYITEQRNL
jgi:hypothetical protein